LTRISAPKHLKALIVVGVILGLALPLYLVPNALGNSFIRSNLRVSYLYVATPGLPVGERIFKVMAEDGTALNVTGIAFTILVSNSYFIPITINYRAPELVLFIYSESVGEPGGALYNDRLVWRTTGSADVGDEDNVRFTSEEELAEHVISIPPAGLRYEFADEATTWNGTDIRTGGLASTGTYYIYALAFNKLAQSVIIVAD